MNRRFLTVLVSAAAGIAALAFAVAPARALPSPQTSTITVTAQVAKSCSMSNGTLDFAAYDPNAPAPRDVPTTFSVNCTKGTTGTISLDAGANGGRNMKGTGANTDLLKYELYSDAGHTSVWDATNTKTATGPGVTMTIFGRIQPGLFVSADSYSDSVTATITF